MHHTDKQILDTSSMYTQDKREYDNQMDSDTNVMLKGDQDNIQVREIIMSSWVIYSGECVHVKWSE